MSSARAGCPGGTHTRAQHEHTFRFPACVQRHHNGSSLSCGAFRVARFPAASPYPLPFTIHSALAADEHNIQTATRAHRAGADSRRRACHSAGTPSSSLLKRLLKGEGVQQSDSLADGQARTRRWWFALCSTTSGKSSRRSATERSPLRYSGRMSRRRRTGRVPPQRHPCCPLLLGGCLRIARPEERGSSRQHGPCGGVAGCGDGAGALARAAHRALTMPLPRQRASASQACR